MGWRGIFVWCLRKYLCLMFCRYCQAERETLVSEKIYYDDMALEEKKKTKKQTKNPLMKTLCPILLSWALPMWKDLAESWPIISWKTFPVMWKNLLKPGIHSQVKTQKSAVYILSFRSSLLLVFFKSLCFPLVVYFWHLQKASLSLEYLLSSDTKNLL